MGWEIPDPAEVSASIIGAQPLQFPVPPTLERAFGYRGDLRFLEFGYSLQVSAIRVFRWRRRHTFGPELVVLVSAPSSNFYTLTRESISHPLWNFFR